MENFDQTGHRSAAAGLAQLRRDYLAEQAAVKQHSADRRAALQRQLDRARKADYVLPYKQQYHAFLEAMEKLYQQVAQLHKNTMGLQFRVREYMAAVEPRPVPAGGVEAYFQRLVAEGKAAVAAVRASKSIDEDVAPLKSFCQCLADLRHMDRLADRLLLEARLPQQDRAQALKPLEAELEQLEEDLQQRLRPENMECYGALCALKAQIEAEREKLSADLLGTEIAGFDGSYRFLVGFRKAQIGQEELAFAQQVLGLSGVELSRQPIYFHYRADHSVILINAPSSVLSTMQFNDCIRNLYFTFASRLPARNLLFAGVECDPDAAVVNGLGYRIGQLDASYLCHAVENQANQLSDRTGTLAQLREMVLENSTRQISESISDIFEYNQIFADNPQKMALLCVNNYPAGFNSAPSAALKDLRHLAASGGKGLITIICQATDGDYRDSVPMLEAAQLRADLVEFDEAGNMRYNGEEAYCTVTTEDFRPREYWNLLEKYFKGAASIPLEDLLQAADRLEEQADPIAIPVGKSDGNLFRLKLTECTDRMFGIIVGTIGSGKSAFLHTLILSAAYTYSPDELQLYLADFKDGSGSTEFSHYRKEPGVENLYIPHVRYLLLKGKSENAFDLLEKIDSIRKERVALLNRLGYSQMDDYNNSPEVRSGKEKKLPNILFVIDEYNAMLGGCDTNGKRSDAGAQIANAIADRIRNLISTCRAYGIGIILCGQSVDYALKGGQALGNMGCRISLPVKEERDLISLFDLDSYEARKRMQQLAGQGDALVSLGRTSNLRYVRTAYSGKTNAQQQRRIAQMIRKKYADCDYSQIEAGSEEAVLITDAAENALCHTPQQNELLLDMGISSANALRVPLVYAEAEAAFNYYACTNREKLSRIEQGAMFAFLRAMAGTQNAPVSYLCIGKKAEETLQPWFTDLPWLRRHIDCFSSKTEIAQKLMDLQKEYRKRKRAADLGGETHFDPMLVVVRDIAWLSDKDANWIPSFGAPPAQTAAKPVNAAPLEALAKAKGIAVNPQLLEMVRNNVAGSTVTAPAAQETFTAQDVRTALATLYAQGNKYGIFLLVSSETYQPIAQILMAETSEKTTALAKFGIFGSFEEAHSHTVDPNAPKDCAYINYFHSKICLYDYSYERCSNWWKDLEASL